MSVVLLGEQNRNIEMLQESQEILTLERILDSSFSPEEYRRLTTLLKGESRKPSKDSELLRDAILERSTTTSVDLNHLIHNARKSAIGILLALEDNYNLPHNLALEIKIDGHPNTPVNYTQINERDVYSGEVHRMRYAVRALQSLSSKDLPKDLRKIDFKSMNPERIEAMIVSSSLIAKFKTGLPFYDSSGELIATIYSVSAREKRGDQTAAKYLETKTNADRNLKDFFGVQIEVARADQIEVVRNSLLGRMSVRTDPSLDHNYVAKPKPGYMEALHTYPEFPILGTHVPIELKVRTRASLRHEEKFDPHPEYKERKRGERRNMWQQFYSNVRIVQSAITEVLRTAQNSFDNPNHMLRVQNQYIMSVEGPRANLPSLVVPYNSSRSN